MFPAIGFGVRPENRRILMDPVITGVEITFEHADDPLRVRRFLGHQQFDYVSVHALELSVAGPETPVPRYLEALRSVAEENEASAVSDHLGFTRDSSSGVGMGHFAPCPYTDAALATTCRNIRLIQQSLKELPFFIENITYTFRLPGTMSEAEFLSRVLEETGCGWLLDVTNVYANAFNHHYDARDFIAAVQPAASRMQVHLAGGFQDQRGEYVDSHSEPIPAAIWDLYAEALELAEGKIEAVFIERDANFPDAQGWRDEIHKARQITDKVLAATEVRS